MKKSWMALLLMPCLTFAAYPMYDEEFAEQEAAESQYADVLQYGMAQKSTENEEAVAYEDDAQEEVRVVAPKQPSVRQGSQSLQQRQLKRPTASTQKQQAPSKSQNQRATSKRSPMKKEASTQSGAAPRARAQTSRQNPNRPQVTYRKNDQTQQTNTDGYLQKGSSRGVKAKSHHSGKRPLTE